MRKKRRGSVTLLLLLSSFVAVALVNLSVIFSLRAFLREEPVNDSFKDAVEYIRLEYNVMQPQNGKKAKSGIKAYLHKFAPIMSSEKDYDYVPSIFMKFGTPGYTLGVGRSSKVSIMIGIRVVNQPYKATYLYATLRSLLQSMYPDEESRIAIVVFLAETEDSYIKATASKVREEFTREVDNGLVKVISAPSGLYAAVNQLPQAKSNQLKRLHKNAKEVFDAAYLMFHCYNKSDYYLIIEEATLTVRGYVKVAEHFAQFYERHPYYFMSLSSWNTVGKMFRSSDILACISYLFTFYGEKTLKQMLNEYVHFRACVPGLTAVQCKAKEELLRPERFPGLFYQTGGTVTREQNEWIEREYLMNKKQLSWNDYKNPPAKIIHSLKAVNHSSPIEHWYKDGGGMNEHFHVEAHQEDDHITIDLLQPRNVSKILVKTGLNNWSERISQKAAAIEFVPPGHGTKAPVRYESCSYFDRNGQAECRFNSTLIAGIRIHFLHQEHKRTLLDLVYIK